MSFSPFVSAATVGTLPAADLPNTTFRDGITESFAASPTYQGHLYLTYEDWDGTQMDVKFTQSTDGGLTWSTPAMVNDNDESRQADRPVPAVDRRRAGRRGGRGVLRPTRSMSVRPERAPADVGRTNFCIDTSLQAYKDSGSGAVPVGANSRISQFTWDPMNPAQHVTGSGRWPVPAPYDPCTRLPSSATTSAWQSPSTKVYSLFVSTHYPSGVTADEGGPVYYQQQVLETVSRAALGL